MKTAFLLLAASLAVGLGTSVQATEQTWVGKISDSHCGASHDAMRANGSNVTDRECTMACVGYGVEGGPEYVFVRDGDDKIFRIANQRFPGLGPRAGRLITVTGELADNAITISKIALAPARD